MQIPADMVVNAMIAAMAAHANQPDETIYHVGSSVSNPLEIASLQDYGQRYFMKHPWIDKDGRAVIVGNVKVLNSMESFQRYLAIHYLLPLKVHIYLLYIHILIYIDTCNMLCIIYLVYTCIYIYIGTRNGEQGVLPILPRHVS